MNSDAGHAALHDRLQALFSLHRPAEAAALADEALTRWHASAAEAADQTLAAEQLHRIARDLLAAAPAPAAPPPMADSSDDEDDDALFDPATRKALRACFATLGTDAAKLILGYYEFGSDGGGNAVAARLRRRQQLAARLGMSTEALRDRALAIRAELEACVCARCAAGGDRA
jgi:hypothetical protein